MKKGIFAIAIIFCFGLAIFALPQAYISPPTTTNPQWAASQWLQLVDAGNFAESWTHAAKSFQSRVTKADWIAGMKKFRGRFGKVSSRDFKGVAYAENPPGGPTGTNATIQYSINFTKGMRADEVISMALQKNGEWRVSSYYIAPHNIVRAL